MKCIVSLLIENVLMEINERNGHKFIDFLSSSMFALIIKHNINSTFRTFMIFEFHFYQQIYNYKNYFRY